MTNRRAKQKSNPNKEVNNVKASVSISALDGTKRKLSKSRNKIVKEVSKKSSSSTSKKISGNSQIYNSHLIIGISILIALLSAICYTFKGGQLLTTTIKEPKTTTYEIITDPSQQWNTSDPILNQAFNFLSNYVCKDSHPSSYCHPLLYPSPSRRTHFVAYTKSASQKSVIERGETVMVLPRHLLIWDLDAMRDGFISKELFGARHVSTGNALDSGAFLAAFCVYQHMKINGSWKEDGQEIKKEKDRHERSPSQPAELSKLSQALNILPSYDTLFKTHPVLWTEEMMKDMFGKYTITYQLISTYKTMILSEYQAFCKVSTLFQNNVAQNDYMQMRLNVMSRSFGPGPPSTHETMKSIHGTNTLDEELSYYEKVAGVNLTKGCRAMSPILDMWDHHAKPNVDWMYIQDKQAFVIKAREKEIPAGFDIMVSYGTYTDSHLFAKFGFVNGDGSGYTEVSIAVMHHLLDVGLGQQFNYMVIGDEYDQNQKKIQTPLATDAEIQRKNLLQYLVSDDGYRDCIKKDDNPQGYELKLLKYRHLEAIANNRERWTVTFQPRNEKSKPTKNSHIPIQTDPPKFNPHKVRFDGSKLIPTCRLLALTNDDYDGKAIEALRKALENGTAGTTFTVDRQSDELEYRALMWLARLTNIALQKYPSTVQKDTDLLSSYAAPFRTKEWNAAQVRLGEMQTLESLRSIASSGTRHMLERFKRNGGDVDSTSMFNRQKVCPFEHTAKLLEA
mmetsp:Transcript_3170/g.4219  ORF Transcript_3170/g.4219 Transcript_3170/m.4219 type:complete len:733 (+) Transcript_3170:42-2240(+)